jgi:hypothetical protein
MNSLRQRPERIHCQARISFSATRWLIAIIGWGLLLGKFANADDPQPEKPQPKLAKRLLALHTADAAEYAIYRDVAKTEKLELRREPVYNWTNVLRGGGQTGAVFVWAYQGCPEVVGSIFSYPSDKQVGQRLILHEMHTLSTAILQPCRESANQWRPRAGLARKPIPGAPAPANSPRQRLAQMRELARSISAHSVDYDRKTWELRMLTQPLYRYESTDPAVLDGALFAWVTSAGTDPEVIVLVEARQTDAGPIWEYAVCRFSDHDLFVKLKGSEIWTSIRAGENVWEHDPNHTYRLFTDRSIAELTDTDADAD